MKKFCLPGPQTLYKEIRSIKMNPGLDNPQLYNMLRMKVHAFQEQNKYCVLCIDEMSIKGHLFYDRANDCIIGLAQNEKQENIFKPALSPCVLMLRGIYSKWKQFLAYYLCHTSCSAQALKNILHEVVNKINLIGLKICALTTDMGSNNLQLAKLLNVTTKNSFFYIENHKLIYIFDIPHVIKAVRNMLLSSQ